MTSRVRVIMAVLLFGRIENLLNDDYVVVPWAPAWLPIGANIGGKVSF